MQVEPISNHCTSLCFIELGRVKCGVEIFVLQSMVSLKRVFTNVSRSWIGVPVVFINLRDVSKNLVREYLDYLKLWLSSKNANNGEKQWMLVLLVFMRWFISFYYAAMWAELDKSLFHYWYWWKLRFTIDIFGVRASVHKLELQVD